eukprot:RCo037054
MDTPKALVPKRGAATQKMTKNPTQRSSFIAHGECVMQDQFRCAACGVDNLCSGCALGPCHRSHEGVEVASRTVFSCDCGTVGHCKLSSAQPTSLSPTVFCGGDMNEY